MLEGRSDRWGQNDEKFRKAKGLAFIFSEMEHHKKVSKWKKIDYISILEDLG